MFCNDFLLLYFIFVVVEGSTSSTLSMKIKHEVHGVNLY